MASKEQSKCVCRMQDPLYMWRTPKQPRVDPGGVRRSNARQMPWETSSSSSPELLSGSGSGSGRSDASSSCMDVTLSHTSRLGQAPVRPSMRAASVGNSLEALLSPPRWPVATRRDR